MGIKAGIIDLGIGNTLALVSMAGNQGYLAEPVSSANHLSTYSHLILPGVGNYARGVQALDDAGFREGISRFVESGKPILGICLGMQLLGTSSEESEELGLGLLEFAVCRLPKTDGTKVPHIGWNYVKSTRTSRLLGDEASALNKFYFNHGFALLDSSNPFSTGVTVSGSGFTSVLESGNIMGVQFHPEKSHRFGMDLMDRFLSL